jgi:L-amino acid N-acyltransferase YncA
VPDPAAPIPLDNGTGRAVRSGLSIRPFAAADWPQVWSIFREVVTAADTYTYDPAMTEDAARGTWIEAPPSITVVAEDGDGRIVGTAKTGPNRPGPGAHIATASFMVAADARGRGIGAALVDDVLDRARSAGYAGMQFNAVAASNTGAVLLYKRYGFRIVCTVPGAFDHPQQGRVGLHVMYRPLP